MDNPLSLLDSFAGLAALVNGLLLWPIVRSLKAGQNKHDQRITKLEAPAPRRKVKSKRTGRWH